MGLIIPVNMSREQQPVPNLVERLAKAQSARARLDYVLDNIGTSNYAQRPDLDPQRYSGLERIAAIRKVGTIKRAIVERTIPQIDTLKASLEAAVRIDADIAEIEEMAKDGYVDEASLRDARQA